MRLSGGSDRIANIFPYQGMSIRNRKRNIAHTDLSASMEHQGLLRSSTELIPTLNSLLSSTDSFSHSNAFHQAPYQATVFQQIPAVAPNGYQNGNFLYSHY